MMLSNEQVEEVKSKAAIIVADRICSEIAEELGTAIGDSAPIPISLASRISGFDIRWINRNLSENIITAPGHVAHITISDLKEAINSRKG